ncbi:MAG: PLP-dependent aminotransferase family protein [Oscillospiraceae bacterium]
MLTYDLSRRGELPLYAYLYRCIRADILEGRLPAGEKLPSKRTLAEHLHISEQTAERVYGQLVAEGYLIAKRCSGHYVAQVELRPAVETPPQKSRNTSETRTFRLDLSSNFSGGDKFPFATWGKLMRRVLSEQDRALLMDVPNTGVTALREAIARHLHSFRGITVSPDQIVIGAGAEYLYQILIQLLGRSRVVGIENPGYRKIGAVYAGNDVRCLPLSLDLEGVILPTEKDSAVKTLHVSPSHHYPTGIVMSPNRRRALLQWAYAGADRMILEDDYDSEFRFAGRPIEPLMAMDTQERVIYLNTFSQTIAPAMRISYMVLPPHLMERYQRTLGFYACPVPSFEQHTLAAFLDGGYFEQHLNRMRNYYKVKREMVLTAFRASSFAERITLTEYGAGLHFLLRVDTQKPAQMLKKRAEERSVRLAFLRDFFTQGAEQVDEHTLVVNYAGLDSTQMAEDMALLAEIFA